MIADPADLYEATWGSVRLWCSAISADHGRTQVVHQPATTTDQNDYDVSDRGPVNRKVACSLLFDEMISDPTPPLDRLRIFLAQVDSGVEAFFTHPIEGSFLVHVEACTYDLDEDTNVGSAQVVFLAVGATTATQPARSASASLTGTDAVSTAADRLTDALTDADIESTVPDDAKAAVDSWSTPDGTIPTLQVLQDAGTINNAITEMIATEELDQDLDLWPAWTAAILLQDAFRAAATAATSETESIFFMRITAPTTVLALIVRIYGGALATTKERQFRALNDVGGVLDVGLEVAMPALAGGPR